MSTDDHVASPSEDNQVDDLTVGGVLRRIREEKGISLNDVQNGTMIPRVKLKGLEDGDYEELGAEVFVSGYIRKYAKFVDADAEFLISIYRREIAEFAPSPEKLIPDTGGLTYIAELPGAPLWLRRMLKQYRHPPFNVVMASLVLVWLLMSSIFPGDRDNETKTPDVISDTAPATDSEALVGLGSGEYRPGLAEVQEETDIGYENPAPIVRQGPNLPVAVAESSQDSLLSFVFSDECWVEVKDKNGVSIFADNRFKGDNLRLFGEAPFNIMLGNARAVTLSMDGVAVDTNVSGSRRTLRLTLAKTEY